MITVFEIVHGGLLDVTDAHCAVADPGGGGGAQQARAPSKL